MSRLSVSNHPDLHHIIANSFTNDENAVHRTLILVELAPTGWLIEFAQTRNIPCFTARTHSDQSDRISALLGTEHPILAHEISDPMDASLLAALAGTVTYAGVLILAIPCSLSGGESSPLNDTSLRILRATTQQHFPISNFSRRFIKLLHNAERAHPNNIVFANYQPDDKTKAEKPLHLHLFQKSSEHRRSSQTWVLAQSEQDSLLRIACKQLASKDSLCISIVGKRGRGKSTLTARIANWLHERDMTYRITAVHSSALSTFHNITDHSSYEYYVSPQELGECHVDTLLVDEASNMPLGTLQNLLRRHKQLILCTTVEGYESSGRAFELRMQHSIKHNFESQLLLSPKQPWRWLLNDPIESLLDSLVLNESSSASHSDNVSGCETHDSFDSNSFCIRKITQQELLEDEQTLKNVFALLRETHYQTTVKDLQHLLDGKDLLLRVLEEKQSGKPVGVLLLTLEPGIEHSLHQAILQKQRRLPHHLLAQLLAQTANSTSHLASSFARVVRISVVESMRRNGIGSMLLADVERELLLSSPGSTCVDAIGASFANETTSVGFWNSNGYTTFHNGYRKNPRTGKQAVAVLKTQDALIGRNLNSAAQIAADNQAWQLAKTCSEGSELMDQQPYDDQLLQQFINGYRSVHDTYAALSRLSLSNPVSLEKDRNVSRKFYEKLLREQVTSIIKLKSVMNNPG